MRFTIEGRLPSWNKFYAGQNYHVRAAIKNEWRARVAEAVRDQEVPSFGKPVNITTYCEYKGTPVDSDNVCDKLIIDGLVKAGVLVDDNGKYVHWALTRAVSTGRDMITVEIKEAEDE